jgi:tryptophan synthase beta chain
VLGSVLNQVLLHQSVIGLETKAALDKYGVKPDIIIGCAGGGSNLGGLISPFMGQKLRGEADYRIIAVEPASCPSLTRGKFAYDFCDTGKVCPLAKMYTLGSGFIPVAQPRRRSALPRHEPILSSSTTTAHGSPLRGADQRLRRRRGICPRRGHPARAGIQPRHQGAMDEALKCRETGEAKTIVFGLTGTGYFDLVAYSSSTTAP